MAGRRVLVVEDRPDQAESLCLLLQLVGFEVRSADSGPKGLALALEWLPHVVLCDIGLPGGLNGWELAARLRQDGRLEHSHLIAISAYASDEDLRRSCRAGFERHFTKPLDPDILLNFLGPSC
jgi:CheY-like chemotaxis protein